jgi:hypothetical protein
MARGLAGKRQRTVPIVEGCWGHGDATVGTALPFEGERQSQLYSLALSRNIGPEANTKIGQPTYGRPTKSGMTAPHARVTPAWFFCGQSAVRSGSDPADRTSGFDAQHIKLADQQIGGNVMRGAGRAICPACRLFYTMPQHRPAGATRRVFFCSGTVDVPDHLTLRFSADVLPLLETS